ncbi:MAG: flagellar export protein FliJ [Pseudomonas sp.]|uniref:flagellar export protein FliJ n=1 Tax=Pseudomonas abieticivorans TaxID=2931382 RepID=UPI0020BFDE6D|nr:flagellar export protein FliJ [Pseudomonas sp. PIA16]MDE1168405.1 flagellar export protein FliJ [Pseudomonas sp.]
MPTSSLDLLTELARKAQDAAARTLAQQRLALQQINSQLQTLQQYNQEYRQALQQKLHKEGMTPASLANYRAFLASLDRAVDRASQSLITKQGEIDKSQLNWQAQWRKTHAYQTLAQRRAAETQRLANRTEQRHSDELSARMQQQPGAFATTCDPSL